MHKKCFENNKPIDVTHTLFLFETLPMELMLVVEERVAAVQVPPPLHRGPSQVAPILAPI